MESINKKNFLITGKYKAHNKQFDKLIIPQDDSYSLSSRQLYQILVSQYATVMLQDNLQIFQDTKQRYPIPIAYACFQFALDNQKYSECLHILQRDLQKQQINRHIALYNIAILYKRMQQERKSVFYLQMLLRQKVTFEDGVYQYCLALLKNKRRKQVVRILYRHLTGQNQNSQILQSLYIKVISQQSIADQKQLLRLFHNKNISPVSSFNLGIFLRKNHQNAKAIQVFQYLYQFLLRFQTQEAPLKTKKLLTMVLINLYQLTENNLDRIQQAKKYKNKMMKYVEIDTDSLKIWPNSLSLPSRRKELTRLTNNGKENIQNVTKTNDYSVQFDSKRKINKKRLLYLLKKEHEINNFFKRVKIYKHQQTSKFQICSKNVINNAKNQLKDSEYKQFSEEFEEKAEVHRLNYNHLEIQQIIHSYFQSVINPPKIAHKQQDQRKRIEQPCIKPKFRIQKINNTFQKFLNSETNFYQSTTSELGKQREQNLMVNSFPQRVMGKKSLQKKPIVELSNFQKALKVGQKLQNEDRWQEAYEYYLKMYKDFKISYEKQQILLKIANVYEKSENYSDAQKTYMKCCKLNNAKAFMKIGSLQIQLGKINEGVENLQKANCIQRFNTQIQKKLIYGYSLNQHSFDKAYSLATSILKRNPQSLETLIMATNILQKQGKIKQALQIAGAIDRAKQSFDFKHYIGLLHLNDSNIAMAYEYFQSAIKLKPDHVPSLIQIATIISEKMPQQSIKILKKVLEYNPKNRLALARLGKIYECVQCDYENAMNTYKKGLQVRQNYQSYMKIGDVYLKTGAILQAFLNYKQALNLKKTTQVYEKIAQIYVHQRQFKKAYQSYQLALSVLDTNLQNLQFKRKLLEGMGKAALSNFDYDNAISAFKQALGIEQTVDIYVKLGDALYGKNEYNQSLINFQTALKMCSDSQNSEILQKIAICFDRKEEYLASKQIYQRILAYNPNNLRCLNNLGNILLIMGQTNEAFYWFQNMLTKAPQNIEKRLRVADIYASVGDWSKVENHLMICYKQKENDIRVIQKLINLYKQKREVKSVQKFQKKLILLKTHKK